LKVIFSITTETPFAKNFITWQLVSTLNSGFHLAMIKDYGSIEKQSTVCWRSCPFYVWNI